MRVPPGINYVCCRGSCFVELDSSDSDGASPTGTWNFRSGEYSWSCFLPKLVETTIATPPKKNFFSITRSPSLGDHNLSPAYATANSWTERFEEALYPENGIFDRPPWLAEQYSVAFGKKNYLWPLTTLEQNASATVGPFFHKKID